MLRKLFSKKVMFFWIMILFCSAICLGNIGTVIAESPCEGDFEYDGDVDGSDLAVFAADFGRTDCPPGIPAGVEKTGQTKSYETGDDGDLETGVAWPNPRFTDNEDGTVTDNLTGLIWLKDANCFGSRNWATALSDCNGLANGSCNLTDGSVAGDWRLPNLKELHSLIHYGVYSPALPNTAGTDRWTEGDPFSNVQSLGFYWSSNTHTVDSAYGVSPGHGGIGFNPKINDYDVWPVRGGQ